MNIREMVEHVATVLEEAPRLGLEIDEPEGHRWIQMSDTLAKELSTGLRAAIVAYLIHQTVEDSADILRSSE